MGNYAYILLLFLLLHPVFVDVSIDLAEDTSPSSIVLHIFPYQKTQASGIILLEPGVYVINNTLEDLVNVTITPMNGTVELVVNTSIFIINSGITFKGPNLKILLNKNTCIINSSIRFSNSIIKPLQNPKNISVITGEFSLINTTIISTTLIINKSPVLLVNYSSVLGSEIFAVDSGRVVIQNSFLNYTRIRLLDPRDQLLLRDNYVIYNYTRDYYRANPLREEFIQTYYINTTVYNTSFIIENNYFNGSYKRLFKLEANGSRLINRQIRFQSNTITGLNTLVKLISEDSNVTINYLEISNNTVFFIDSLDPELLQIYSHSNSSISVTHALIVFNSQVLPYTVFKYGYLLSLKNNNGSIINFSNILVYGNVFVSHSLTPFINHTGGRVYYNIQYYSPSPITYVYRGRKYSSKIGNFFGYLLDVGVNYIDLNNDGLSDKPVVVNEYYDPKPIYFHKLGYNWTLINKWEFIVESNNITKIYRLRRAYYIILFPFLYTYNYNDSDTVYIVGKYLHILIIKYYSIDNITIAYNTTYNAYNSPLQIEYNNNWLNITTPLNSTISIYLGSLYPVNVYGAGKYTYSTMQNIIICTGTSYCKIMFTRENINPLPENIVVSIAIMLSVLIILAKRLRRAE